MLDFLVLVLVPTTWGQPISCFVKVKVKVKVGAKPLVGAGGKHRKKYAYNGHKTPGCLVVSQLSNDVSSADTLADLAGSLRLSKPP